MGLFHHHHSLFRGRVGPRSVLSFRRNAARRPASLSYCQALLFLKLFKLRLGKYFKPLKPLANSRFHMSGSAPDSVRNISDMMWVKSSFRQCPAYHLYVDMAISCHRYLGYMLEACQIICEMCMSDLF